MASVITSFLVGVGYDTEALRAGERDIATSMEGVKSLASTTGAALASAFVGVGATASQTAERVNNLRLNTNQLYTSTQYVNDYGNALRSLGGNATDAVGEITRVETALSNMRNRGDDSGLRDLGLYGIGADNYNKLTTSESGGQFMERLSEIFPGLNRDQQQGVANTLGLSPATVELLRKGSDGYRDVLSHVHEVAGLSDDLIEKSRQYNAAIAEAQNRWEGVANTISSGVLPKMTSLINVGSDFISDVIKPMAEENPASTGAGLSLLGAGAASSVVGPLLSGLGLGGIGAGAAALGLPLAAAGAGVLAISQSDKIFDTSSDNTTAGGVFHKGSWLGNMWDAPAPTETQGSGYTQDYLRDVQSKANPYMNNSFTPPQIDNDNSITNYSFPESKQWFTGDTHNIDNSTHNKNEYNPVSLMNSPSDALDQDYEAQKRTYIDTSSYAPEAQVNDYNSAAAVGQAVAEKLYAVPLKATVTNNVDMRVELDGRALDSKITEVQQRNNQMTVDDMQSTTAR